MQGQQQLQELEASGGRNLEAAEDKAGQAYNSVTSALHNSYDSAQQRSREAYQGVKDSTEDVTQSAEQRGRGVYESAKRMASDSADRFSDTAKQYSGAARYQMIVH